ncbi:MAG: Extracellular serine protease [Chlamydiae bacterium]|nr:Extracellular serine protease [Chlamydiota bacterium]
MLKNFAFALCTPIFVYSATVIDANDFNTKIGNLTTSIDFGNDIDLSGLTQIQLTPVNSNSDFTTASSNITIDGKGKKLWDSGNTHRGLFIHGGTGFTVTIKDLDIEDLAALNPSSGAGGGGPGLGGGLFINETATVILEDVTFSNCSATGGNGGSSVIGGGGGFMSNGGTTTSSRGGGGGGGLFGNGATSILGGTPGGGGGGALNPGLNTGVGGGDFAGANGGAVDTAGGNGGGGGGGSFPGENPGKSGGIGGGGGGGSENSSGSAGDGADNSSFDFGGGGGGGDAGPAATPGNGGDGGFAGGGGSSGFKSSGSVYETGGTGGFGGGGGQGSPAGTGGFGGGGATTSSSGGGAGFGGAIFIRKGGNLTIKTSSGFSSNSVQAGTGANAGNTLQALGKDIFMMSGSFITFNLSSDLTLLNPIKSDKAGITGTFTKKGAATLNLQGENTYTGTTTVEAGRLHIDGSIISDVTVNSGASLSGDLTIKSHSTMNGDLINHGTVSPGCNNIGTINIDGNYTQSATGILDINITPTINQSDKIFIDDLKNATLADGTTVQVLIGSGNYIKGTQYFVINGPTSFDNKKINIEKIGPFADKVEVKILPSASLILEVEDSVLFDTDCPLSENAQTVVNAILNMTITPSSQLATIIETMGLLDCEALETALNNMSAANYGNLEWITVSTDAQISSIFANHIYSLKCSKTPCGSCENTGVWINGIVDFNNVDSFDFLSGFDANTKGAVIGADRCWNSFYFGMGGGYTYTDFNLKNQAGFGHIHSGFGAVYGSFVSKHFVSNASVTAGGKFFNMHRKIAFLNIDETPHSTFDSPFVNTHLGLMAQGYFHDFRLEIFGNMDYHYLYIDPALETGSVLNLCVIKHYSHFLRGEVGTTLKGLFSYQNVCLVPFVGISVIQTGPLENTQYGASFENSCFYMDTFTSNKFQTLISPRCGLHIHTQSYIFSIGYVGEFNHYTKDHKIDGRFEWTF